MPQPAPASSRSASTHSASRADRTADHRRWWWSCCVAGLFGCGVLLLAGVPGNRQAVLSAEKKAEDAKADDFARELPRIPPKSPEEAVKTFQLRPGFAIELVASEPLIHDPVAIDFDARGRMYVCEMPEYNQYVNPDFKGSGAVRLLEDTDGDGRYDKAHPFLENVSSPAAVACWDGGVFVGVVPHILYCKDTTGDGRADLVEQVYTGFARDHAGEAMLNSIRWGFDNRFHLSTSLAGGDVKPAGSEEAAVSVRGRGFIFDPRDRSFELTSGAGQHGMSMDDWGRKFVCSNSNPAQSLMYDDRYVARNPALQAPTAEVTIAPEGKYTKLFRISPNEPWRVLRTRLRSEGKVRGSDEGGKPSGFFTGATGVTIYRGDAWPEEYRGNLFVGEVASNMVYRANVTPKGLGVEASRADKDVEFLASTDNWFRPVQLANGPDGNLYVVDMYRELIEGAAFLPPEFLKHLDVASGVDKGRIWRIVRTSPDQEELPNLAEADTRELVSHLDSPNGWTRDTASRLIYERQDSSAVSPLRELSRTGQLPQGRMTALYSLAGLNALNATDVLTGLNDPSADVRIQALKLAEQVAGSSGPVRLKMAELADDDDMRVRYQLAFSLGAIDGPQRPQIATGLLLREGQNSWLRLAVFSSLSEGAGEVFRRLATDEKWRKSAAGPVVLKDLATLIGAAGRRDDLAAVLAVFGQLPADEQNLQQELVRSLLSRQKGGKTGLSAESSGAGELQKILDGMIGEAKTIAPDSEQPVPQRVEAIGTLSFGSLEDLQELLESLLDLRQPPEIQLAAIETLGRFRSDLVPGILLEGWSGYSPAVRQRAVEILFSRSPWILQLLGAIEQQKIARGDIDAARTVLLKSHPDEKIRQQAMKLFTGSGAAARKAVIEKYRPALELTGEATRGQAIFRKTCSACHRLEDYGTQVGEDLTAIRNRGLEAVLLNVLDPNREVKPQFLSYVALTEDGLTITGMIASENANSLTFRRPDGKTVVVARNEIEELRSTGLSFMPEGLEKQIDVQQMADLLAYLNSIR